VVFTPAAVNSYQKNIDGTTWTAGGTYEYSKIDLYQAFGTQTAALA
jgi:hypothetical protein